MDMLVGEIKQLKEKSENRIHALKEELATTNQHLSKAITVITDIENNALSYCEQIQVLFAIHIKIL
jgi:hypothetical protein